MLKIAFGRLRWDSAFVAQRLIEHAWATHDGSLLLLSLDWAKAFDSVAPIILVKTLQGFGIPTHSCRVVQAVYSHGRSQVRVDGRMSTTRCSGGLNLPAALANDLVYAKGTLVVAVEQERAELHMNCIARAGSNYALTFNWKKGTVDANSMPSLHSETKRV